MDEIERTLSQNGLQKDNKSRETRLRILRTLDFIPDKTMIKMQYFIKTGRRLNLKNPQRSHRKAAMVQALLPRPVNAAVC